MKFSVLMSVYINDQADHFDRAMQSIWDEQEVKPNEIILIVDGPISSEIGFILTAWTEKLQDILKIFKLDQNMGNGFAKKYGLERCSHGLVAIMDADDISLKSRFKKQLNCFKEKNIDVCGAWVGEFQDDESIINSINKRPEKHDEIYVYSKSRIPVNHPTAMFKKQSVIDAGGYGNNLPSCEDQYLFVRMLLNGARFYNIQESLLNMRVNNTLIEKRRSGWSHNLKEINAQIKFYQLGFLNKPQFLKNIVLGSLFRLMPKFIVKYLYRIIRKYF